MSRKPHTPRKAVKYRGSEPEFVSRFINYIMYDGKKSIARSIFSKVLERLESMASERKCTTHDLFLVAVDNVSPSVQMKSRRVGGTTYRIPVPLEKSKANVIAMKWIILAARSLSGRDMEDRLYSVILDAIHNRGAAIKKKEEVQKTAEANKAFAHFAS